MTHGELEVTVNEPKTTGSKGIMKRELKNTFKKKIQSGRAVVFLPDD